MPDWTKSMQQTFEYYVVDPGTWRNVRRLDNIKKCSINRDSETDTLGSATVDATESLGEFYIRIYLVTIQNGVREEHPLGTYLVQTPSSSFTGTIKEVSMDAYTPLIELKENPPAIGYFLEEGSNIMEKAYYLVRDNLRAPVVRASDDKLLDGTFVAETNDNWLSYTSDLISLAEYSFDLDEMGRILFAPKQKTEALQPVWTFDDSNSSILYPDVSIQHDLFDIPNVVEVIYTNGNTRISKTVVNDNPNSPTSTVSRGRKKTYVDTSPSFTGTPTEHQVEEYANNLLEELSTIEYSISFTHAYCPVRLGDCVRLNYERAGLTNVKAKIISQSINCEPGCPVKAKAIFTKQLWR